MMARSRDSKAGLRMFAGALAIAGLALVFFFNSHIGSYGRGLLASLFAPRSENPEYLGLSKDALTERLAHAESELSRTKYQALLYAALAAENAKLREAVSAATVPQGLTARVIARPPKISYDTLLVDRGAEAGVRENDSATYNGIALGRIIKVDAKTSLVSLFSSSGTSHDVILGEPRAVAVATGLGGGAFELSLPQGIAVAPGDSVRFPATESLILGVVKSVSSEMQGASQRVRLALPLSFAELDFIQIVPSR